MITPAGLTHRETWQALLEKRSSVIGLQPEHLPEEHRHVYGSTTTLPSRVVGKIDHAIVKEKVLQRTALQQYSALESVVLPTAFVQFACLAADDALRDAGMLTISGKKMEKVDPAEVGVCIGAGMSSTRDLAQAGVLVANEKTRRLSPFFVPRILVNTASGSVSAIYGLRGPNLAPSTACATGAHAIGDAFRIVQRGDATAMLAGGTESCVDAISLAGFSRMKALSTSFNASPERASRPFDADRDGFVLSEGSCVLVLEELEHARSRGANIYCEIIGYGMSGDAHHVTKPSPQGAMLSMTRALGSAGVQPGNVAYVNAHATSTPLGDTSELDAIHQMFLSTGHRAAPLHVSSSKGALGHMLGAAGAAEAAIAALACHYGVAPPNTNLDKVDGRLKEREDRGGLSLLRDAVVFDDDALTVVSNSLGFGGTNTSLVLRRFLV
jgi:3-oxoacyl-[acyl-carrier-protein] synthase II